MFRPSCQVFRYVGSWALAQLNGKTCKIRPLRQHTVFQRIRFVFRGFRGAENPIELNQCLPLCQFVRVCLEIKDVTITYLKQSPFERQESGVQSSLCGS